MLCSQALLLRGYADAHWLGRVTVRRQAVIHLALFLVAALWLPIGNAARTARPGAGGAVGALAPARVDRPCILHRVGAGAVDATLVRRRSPRRRPLLYLRRVEPRQLCRPHQLSGARRTGDAARGAKLRSEEPKSELPSLMRNSYAVFCL